MRLLATTLVSLFVIGLLAACRGEATSSPPVVPASSATVQMASESSGAIWQPRPGTSWQIQLTGTVDTSVAAQVYGVDLLADQAHRRGMSIGLKNDLGQIPELLSQFDWAINEQCFQYEECELLLPFVQAGKPVFGIEYELDQADFCPQANAMNFDFLKKRPELEAWRLPCR